MKVGIRADASSHIGSGHIMRCLALAEAVIRHGGDVVFFCREITPYLQRELIKKGCLLSILSTRTTTTKHNQAEDAANTIQLMEGEFFDVIIVDHYQLDQTWEHKLKTECRTLMVIDDLVDRNHECDLLVDQTLGREPGEYVMLVPDKCRLLTGCNFALLRPEFSKLKADRNSIERDYELKKIVVSLGTSDVSDLLMQILIRLDDLFSNRDIEIIVIAPEGQVQPTFSPSANITINGPTDRIAEILSEADLAIGAAGSSTWERFCLGIPSYVFTIADNQIESARKIDHAGAAINARSVDDLFTGKLDINNSGLGRALEEMGRKAGQLVDGKGVDRTLNAILETLAK